jgi:hypothetical protein
VVRRKSYWPNIIGGGLAIMMVVILLGVIVLCGTAVSEKMPFWSEPVVRDLVITNPAGEVATVRQMILVSYEGLEGDEIKPETGNGKMTIWVYRQGRRFKEAPTEYPGLDGRISSVNGYLLFNPVSRRLVTFLLDGGTAIPSTVAKPVENSDI